MERESRIYIAGHTGLVGSAVCRQLTAGGYTNQLVAPQSECDLTNQTDVQEFFRAHRPEYVIIAAAKVGGIYANSRFPAEFIYTNLMIACNLIHAAYQTGVKKLLFLGSSCIYPKFSPQPIREDYLLSGPLEPTNEAYALAKISGLKLCDYYRKQYGCDFISAMPTNLYGPGDNFDLVTSHVLPAMIRKFHTAKILNEPEVVLWGTGQARREFLFVEDLAGALIFLMHRYSQSGHINIGTGADIYIRDLAKKVQGVVGYRGTIRWDITRPDGTPRKLLDVSKIKELGWAASTPLESGIERSYQWFLENIADSLMDDMGDVNGYRSARE